MTTNQTERVSDEELDQMIWKLERDGMTPKMLSLMRELRDVRRAVTPTDDERIMAIEGIAPPAPVVPGVIATDDIPYSVGRFRTHRDCYRDGWNACRAAMLQSDGTLTNEETMQLSGNSEQLEPVSNRDELPTNSFTDAELEMMAHGNNPQANAYRQALAFRRNSPATQNGWVMVPMKLTAENGAKAALIGEFNLEYTLTCHECFGEGCDDCSGEGAWINTIPIDWTTIKEIWAKGVEHFSVAPQEAKGE